MRPGHLGSFPFLLGIGRWISDDLWFPISLGLEPRCWASRSEAGLALENGVSNGKQEEISPRGAGFASELGEPSLSQDRGWTPAIFSHSVRIGFPLHLRVRITIFQHLNWNTQQ